MNTIWRAVIVLLISAGVAAHATSQGPQVNTLMRAKLEHSQKILEAVVTSDWVGLERNSRELEQLTNDRRWTIFTYPEYARHSAAFVRAVQDLHAAAAQRDLDKTPKAYVTMTLECVECHRYMARARIAR